MTYTISNPSDTRDLRDLGDRLAEAALAASKTDADVAAARTAAATEYGADLSADDLAGILDDVAA